jgi:hypothetical protein
VVTWTIRDLWPSRGMHVQKLTGYFRVVLKRCAVYSRVLRIIKCFSSLYLFGKSSGFIHSSDSYTFIVFLVRPPHRRCSPGRCISGVLQAIATRESWKATIIRLTGNLGDTGPSLDPGSALIDPRIRSSVPVKPN